MPTRARAAATAAVPFLLLPLCWVPAYLAGGATHAPPLLIFGPILLAAVGAALAARRLTRQALRDALTGLPNRAMLAEHLQVSLARARRTGRAVALASIDLDDFKLVNDNLGHAAGDRLLVAVAERLRSCLRDTDVLARQGGDEFLLLLADHDDADAARRAATATFERIRAALDAPFGLDGAELAIGVSMGVGVFPADAADAETLHRHADASMYRAKAAGGGLTFFAEDEAPAPLARLSLAARLRRAIDGGELEVHYQPIWNLEQGGIMGLESLVRWRHPRRGLVPPIEFVPVAEQTGVIDALGEWVLEETCRQARVWQDLGLFPGFGVNVSPHQLRRPGFADRLLGTIAAYDLEPGRFIVELTESAWMLDADRSLATLAELRAGGVVLALDDFGAGYSSLSRLLHLPLQIVKVDRQFLEGVPESADATAVLEAIMHLAVTCGCDVVVEGVETDAQRDVLVGMGAKIGQGFGLGRPVMAGPATALLLEHLLPARRADPGEARAHAH